MLNMFAIDEMAKGIQFAYFHQKLAKKNCIYIIVK